MLSRSMLTLYTICSLYAPSCPRLLTGPKERQRYGIFGKILIVILVLILFLLVLSIILFRDTVEACCCPVHFRRRGQPPLIRGLARGEITSGLRNPGFDEQERPRRMPEQRPFDPMEQVESPPSYDEAMRQELFRFQPQHTTITDRTHASTGDTITEEENHQQTNPSSGDSIISACASDDHTSLPTTSCAQSSRKKVGVGNAIATQLSTIREEQEEWPVTVVIDRIGVQAARLMENCETTVNLENGSELRTHSKC